MPLSLSVFVYSFLFFSIIQCGEECFKRGGLSGDPTATQQCEELVRMCKIFQIFVDCFWDHELDVKDRLTNLSYFAHVIFYIYRKNGTKFLPSVLYFDLMSFVVPSFTLASMHQKYFRYSNFYLFLLGDDRLKLLFSALRTIQHGLSLDCVQMQDRIESALTIEQVFLKYPDWRSPSRKIGSGDYINAEMIKGECSIKDLSLELLWTTGASKALSFLEELDPNIIGTINWWSLHLEGINIVQPFICNFIIITVPK